MLVDSHCHLDFESFEPDREAVLARARAAGIGGFVTIATRLTRFDGVRVIAEAEDDVWCTVGIHPHHVAEEPTATVAGLVALARHPKVVGIGESGLDYYYDRSPRAAQQASFRTHLRAAREAAVPIVVHARDADDDIAAILREAAGEGPIAGVMHCFSSGAALARAALELGFHVSFSGIVTFRNSDALRDIAREVPIDRMLVETDAPFLAPVPMRGKRNEPAFVAHTATALAALKDMPDAEFAAATTANFYRLFTRARPAGAA